MQENNNEEKLTAKEEEALLLIGKGAEMLGWKLGIQKHADEVNGLLVGTEEWIEHMCNSTIMLEKEEGDNEGDD